MRVFISYRRAEDNKSYIVGTIHEKVANVSRAPAFPAREVRYVKFDGPNLLTIHQDEFDTPWLTRWNIDPRNWFRLACEAIGRSLTVSKLEHFLLNQPYEKTCESNPWFSTRQSIMTGILQVKYESCITT